MFRISTSIAVYSAKMFFGRHQGDRAAALIAPSLAFRTNSCVLAHNSGFTAELIEFIDYRLDSGQAEALVARRTGPEKPYSVRVSYRVGMCLYLAVPHYSPMPFDVVVIDQGMPDLGAGLSSLFFKIRADIPIILLTGAADELAAKNAGVSRIMQ
jgi:hypothetical protein